MTETQGEKELILGNKQLISLFFVVVALCGVCFAMGYIIGRNSSKPAVAADAPQSQAAAPAHAQDSEPPRETSEAAPNPAPDSGSASQAAQDSAQSSPSGQASSSGPAADNAAPSSAPQANDTVATRPGRDVPEPARAPEVETSPVSASPAPQPGAGSYLQVGAVSKVDAENLVRTLKEQKLPALMAESPKKGLYRVLVGPYHQTADLADAKSKLKTLGFDNAFVQK